MNAAIQQELLVEDIDSVRVFSLNRPDRYNALSRSLCESLARGLGDAAIDPTVRCVVLTGIGRAFCAGGDVEVQTADAQASSCLPESDADGLRNRMESVRHLHQMPKPTIAMLNGVAAGAGMSLALACDLRVASDHARMTTAFAKVGLSGDYGGSYFLSKLIGTALARELYFTSPMLDVERLVALNLVNRRVSSDSLREETMRLAIELANGPTLAYRYMKRNLNLALFGRLEDVLESEVAGTVRTLRSHDHKEGAEAFMQKRSHQFIGN
jgi:2-(1,2-epoxy-1,2-dihydrophenyl)acetyl-CoA isomerase